MAMNSEKYTALRERFGESFDEFLRGDYESPEDNNRWTGYVIDNKDPARRGRVKVLVIGKYDDIPEPSIPWAVPDISYMGAIAGNFVVPEVGAVVRGYFDHNDIHKPIFDSLAFNYDNTILSKTSVFLDYPNKMILMQTTGGECLTVNRANGETTFKHRSGAMITIATNGDISITAGMSDPSSPGNIKVTTEMGNIDVTSTAGEVNVKSDTGNINIDGLMVNLGKNQAAQFVNNLPTCLVTGAPHFVGNTNVRC